jgi:methionyl-tRNA synthetase
MLLADTLARFARLQNPDRTVHFVTGTDEHGLKIQNAARDTGMSPQAMCDKNSQRFRVSSGTVDASRSSCG